MALFSELRRRNVIRVAAAYLAGVWLVLQVADVVLSGFESPAWILRALLIAGALGFPIALLLAWFYELTPEGVKSADSVPGNDDPFLGRKIDFVIIGVLVLAVVFLAINNYTPEERDEANSIAVLPFADFSPARDQSYFSDGISEEIINLLTRVDGLRVVARTSAFSLGKRNLTAIEIANQLNVRFLLEGSVRRDGEMIRITAQLIDARSDSHVWSQNYDRKLVDVFSIQDEVAASIIDKLPVSIAGERPMRGQPTDDPRAYASFLRARHHLNDFRVREAMDAVNQAIGFDPEFAEAYELRASIYWSFAGELLNAADAQALMGENAARALQFDASLALASAMAEAGDLDNYTFAGELSAFEQAAAAEPNNPAVLEPLVFNLRKAGYLEEALAYARQLVLVDPYSTAAHGRLQSSLMACGRPRDAISDIGGELYTRLSSASRDVADDPDGIGRFDDDDWFVAELALLLGEDDLAIERLSARLEGEGFDTFWLPDLVDGARAAGAVDPAHGAAFLDARVSEIIAEARRKLTTQAQDLEAATSKELWLSRRLSRLYLAFGFLDRYYDIIWERGVTGSAWPDAEDLIAAGISYPMTGFTSHTRFLELAAALGLVQSWEKRGPPDFCQRQAGNWKCGGLPSPCAN